MATRPNSKNPLLASGYPPSKPLLGVGASVLATAFLVVYSMAFFRANLWVDPESNQGFSRAAAFLNLLVIPDSILQFWTAYGEMPLGLVDRIGPFVAVISWLGLAFWIGNRGLLVLGISRQLHRIERIGLATTAGLQYLSLLALALGLFGGVATRWPLLVAIVVSVIVLGLVKTDPTPIAQLDRWGRMTRPHRRFAGLTAIALGLLGLFYLLTAVLPPHDFDVREYHLQVPKEFQQRGSIGFMAHNIYANMPLGAEMHSLSWMVLLGREHWFMGALIGKMITASFAILTALTIGGIVLRHVGKLGAWVAPLLYLGSPGVLENAGSGLIDVVMASYVASSFACFSLLMDREREQPRLRSIAVLLGWYLGAAASCKYTAVPMVCLPALVLLGIAGWSITSFQRSTTLKLICIAALACSISGGLWYAKNTIFAGNPVYPLLAKQLGGATMNASKIEQWGRVHQVPRAPDGTSPDLRLSTMTGDFYEVLVGSKQLGLLLIPLGLIGIFTSRLWIVRFAWIWASLALMIWWMATHRLERFWIPTLPLWACLAGWGADWFSMRLRGIPFYVLCLVGTLYSLLLISNWPFIDRNILVELDALRHDRLRPNATGLVLPNRVPLHQKWINRELANGKVLLVGDAAVFDIEVPILYSTCFDTCWFESATRDRSPAEQRKGLKDLGVTHVLIDWREIERYRSPGNYGFSDYVTRTLMQNMIDQKVIKRVAWPIDSSEADLYEVVPSE